MNLSQMRVAVIGAGMMGGALARGVVQSGAIPSSGFTVFDTLTNKAQTLAAELGEGAVAAPTIVEAIPGSDIILLAVKPGIVVKVLTEIGPSLLPTQLIVSLAAGVRIAKLEAAVPAGIPVIRTMPNTPCMIGAGATALCRGAHAAQEHAELAKGLFDAIGVSVEVEDERLMDAVTGLSGSGPAYVYMMIESLADAGVKVGLSRDTARLLAAQTVLGSAKMVVTSNSHTAQLKDNVTSPGGTTIAGVAALERCGFRNAVIEAVDAATSRSRELG